MCLPIQLQSISINKNNRRKSIMITSFCSYAAMQLPSMTILQDFNRGRSETSLNIKQFRFLAIDSFDQILIYISLIRKNICFVVFHISHLFYVFSNYCIYMSTLHVLSSSLFSFFSHSLLLLLLDITKNRSFDV
jgi:hypothetical protein